jgi:predicted transcriptional regulator
MRMARKSLFISIKPRYAEMIFSGTKTVELRRTEPRVAKGDKMIVYVSSPEKVVTGHCTVTEIEKDTPKKLWLRIRDKAGVTKEEFDDYFDGASQAIAIHVRKPKKFGNPVCLGTLREDFSLQPPQSFRYVEAGDWAGCV